MIWPFLTAKVLPLLLLTTASLRIFIVSSEMNLIFATLADRTAQKQESRFPSPAQAD
jgi:hypothetical protein